VFAAMLVAQLISEDDLGTTAGEAMFSDPDDFSRFVKQHNWRDPVSMACLASSVDFAANHAAQGRGTANDSRGSSTHARRMAECRRTRLARVRDEMGELLAEQTGLAVTPKQAYHPFG
jgi:hypothetical protein